MSNSPFTGSTIDSDILVVNTLKTTWFGTLHVFQCLLIGYLSLLFFIEDHNQYERLLGAFTYFVTPSANFTHSVLYSLFITGCVWLLLCPTLLHSNRDIQYRQSSRRLKLFVLTSLIISGISFGCTVTLSQMPDFHWLKLVSFAHFISIMICAIRWHQTHNFKLERKVTWLNRAYFLMVGYWLCLFALMLLSISEQAILHNKDITDNLIYTAMGFGILFVPLCASGLYLAIEKRKKAIGVRTCTLLIGVFSNVLLLFASIKQLWLPLIYYH